MSNPLHTNKQFYFKQINQSSLSTKFSCISPIDRTLSGAIAPGKSGPGEDDNSCCMNVRAGHPAFDWPYAGVHRSTSLTISSLLLQQCPACLVRLAYIIFVIAYIIFVIAYIIRLAYIIFVIRGTPHSSMLQHYWDLTIRLFSVISRTLIKGVVIYCCCGC